MVVESIVWGTRIRWLYVSRRSSIVITNVKLLLFGACKNVMKHFYIFLDILNLLFIYKPMNLQIAYSLIQSFHRPSSRPNTLTSDIYIYLISETFNIRKYARAEGVGEKISLKTSSYSRLFQHWAWYTIFSTHLFPHSLWCILPPPETRNFVQLQPTLIYLVA